MKPFLKKLLLTSLILITAIVIVAGTAFSDPDVPGPGVGDGKDQTTPSEAEALNAIYNLAGEGTDTRTAVDYIKSGKSWDLAPDNIRYMLSSIKSLAERAVIIEAAEGYEGFTFEDAQGNRYAMGEKLSDGTVLAYDPNLIKDTLNLDERLRAADDDTIQKLVDAGNKVVKREDWDKDGEHKDDKVLIVPAIIDGEEVYIIIGRGLEISESQISVAISTLRSPGYLWKAAEFVFEYQTHAHEHEFTWYCAGCVSTSWTDDKGNSYTSSYCTGHTETCAAIMIGGNDTDTSYNFLNVSPIDSTIQADGFGAFKPKFTRDTMDAIRHDALLGGGSNSVRSFDHESVIWRGKDKPYILSGPGEFNGGGGKRASNGSIQAPFLVTLAADYANGDYQTHSVHGNPRCQSYGSVAQPRQHTEADTFPYPESITVKTYRGVAKPTGDETSTSSLTLPMLITNNTTYHASGRMIQSSTPVTFYPTIRMTWQNVSQYGSKNDASVRSEQLSTIIPNNYAEAGWFNESYESNKPTMNLKSNQWSTHVRATQPDSKIKDSDTWRGINQVLPGGAIYGLDIPESANTKLKLATWQFFIPSSEQSKFQSGASEYSLSSAIQHHKDYVDEAKKVLESYRVVQWVNDDVSAEYAWSPGGVLINGPSSSLTGLEGLSGNASTEDKYYLRPNPVESNPPTGNRGDLDILDEQLKNVFIKCYSDTSGNIYLAYAFDEGSIVGAKGIKICDKKTTWQQIKSGAIKSNIDSALPPSLAGLEEKTYFVTNFVKSIERNTGNDSSASWAPDGKWYNEAFEAVYMVYQETNLEVGFATPKQRTAALDPKLCPINTGRADLFSKAFLSQFRIQPLSDSGIASGQNNWFVAKFRGVPILMQDLEDVYVTRKFYIPNVNVQDLQNW